MKLKPTPPSIAILVVTLIVILGSLVSVPKYRFLAQSCNTGEQTHIVSNGENLFRIGLRYGVSYTSIAARNGINDVTRIYTGQSICIPVGGTPNTNTQIITQVIVVTATPTTPTSTTAQTTTVKSGEENWCYSGQPWGYGRCLHPDNPSLQNYWFYAGWCNAQVELGNYTGTLEECLSGAPSSGSSNTTSSGSSSNTTVTTVVTTYNFSLVDDDEEFACTIIYDKDTGTITALAQWEDAYTDQEQVIFFTNLPNFSNQAADIGEDDEQVGITGFTDPHKTFSQASARLKTRETVEDPSMNAATADCARIET